MDASVELIAAYCGLLRLIASMCGCIWPQGCMRRCIRIWMHLRMASLRIQELIAAYCGLLRFIASVYGCIWPYASRNTGIRPATRPRSAHDRRSGPGPGLNACIVCISPLPPSLRLCLSPSLPPSTDAGRPWPYECRSYGTCPWPAARRAWACGRPRGLPADRRRPKVV